MSSTKANLQIGLVSNRLYLHRVALIRSLTTGALADIAKVFQESREEAVKAGSVAAAYCTTDSLIVLYGVALECYAQQVCAIQRKPNTDARTAQLSQAARSFRDAGPVYRPYLTGRTQPLLSESLVSIAITEGGKLLTTAIQLLKHFTPSTEAGYVDELHKESAEKLRQSLTRSEQKMSRN